MFIHFDHNILKKAHDEDYVDMVQKSFPKEGIKFLDGDTIISPGSKDATIDAVGSVIQAIEGVEKKSLRMLFVLYVLLGTIVKRIRRWAFVFTIIVQ